MRRYQKWPTWLPESVWVWSYFNLKMVIFQKLVIFLPKMDTYVYIKEINRYMKTVIWDSGSGGGLWNVYGAVSRRGIRWCSKVVEIKGMVDPELEKKFQKKISSGKYFPELEMLAALRFWAILGEIPVVKTSWFKWKIEGPPSCTSSEKYFPMRFFSETFFPGPARAYLSFPLL